MLHKGKHMGTIFVSILLLACSTALIAAPAEKEGHLIITEVSVDYETSSMVIIGYDLDFGDGPLAVILGDTDISAACALDDPEADPQTISCVDLVLPVAADLLLVVSNGGGAPQIDEYDLTFGAVGPQGEQGGRGEQGETGPAGEDGDDGADGATGADGADGADGSDGASCSITECVEPGVATLTCGIDSVPIPCRLPTLACPCWDTLTEDELIAALNDSDVTHPECGWHSGVVVHAIDLADSDPVLFTSLERACQARVGEVGLDVIRYNLSEAETVVCLAEAEGLFTQITWCPD